MLLQSAAIFLSFLLLVKTEQSRDDTAANVSPSATSANCFPSDPVKNPDGGFICEGDYIRLYSVDAKSQHQYLAIKDTPDAGPPSYVRNAMTTGHSYPFKLRDTSGRWLKISPGNYKDKKYQTLYVDNWEAVYDDHTNPTMLLYVPNTVYTSRSSMAGGAPAGWILDAAQGLVLWDYYQERVAFDWAGPNPSQVPGCETLTLWTIEQTQSPTEFTGYIEKVLNLKYAITNVGATEQNLILTMSTTQSNTWMFNRDQRFKYSVTGQGWVGVPFLGTGMSVSVSADIAFTTGRGNSQTKSTYFSVSAMIPVPGQSVISGSIWMTKATMKQVPLMYTVQRTWPDGKVVTFEVTDTVDVVQYYDAVICISKASGIDLGQTPACVPPALSMGKSTGSSGIILPFLQA
ncbi:hypothetical protein SmJEL517_g01870 [Synchytrium microbalum]|uniref:Uncharacterized protein n=1 Tax=Synchytrium microbalum TaxID=1806994 RepID=A0A507CCX4_9FUNG|nr:uncharacterized protein SmJEL517_g01870 [Synchytrium microbalum]TPX35774.1 hypothetical protein SmJEL517_g01870 [Synchytrium microbalum]